VLGARAGGYATASWTNTALSSSRSISLEPVASRTSPGSTQSAQAISAKRRFTAHSFLTTCEFEFSGQGSQQSLFDLTNQIRRQERKLKEGGKRVAFLLVDALRHELGVELDSLQRTDNAHARCSYSANEL